MTSLFCYFSVPTGCGNDGPADVYKVYYKENIYVIDKIKLYDVLSQLMLLSAFIKECENDSVLIGKWLKSKGLINEYFLKEICSYNVSCKGNKDSEKHRMFIKSSNLDVMLNDLIKNTYSGTHFFDFLSKNKEKLNERTKKLIDEIKNDPNSINYYRENIFKFIATEFLQLNFENETNNFCIEIFPQENLTEDSLGIYKTTNLGEKFNLKNAFSQECIKEKTVIRIDLKSPDKYFIDSFLEKSYKFTQKRLEFEKTCLKKLIKDNQIPKGFHKLSSNSEDGVVITEKRINSENFVDLFFLSSSYMNCISGTFDYLRNLSIVLNLNDEIINELNELLFEKDIKEELFNLVYDMFSNTFSPINYFKLLKV